MSRPSLIVAFLALIVAVSAEFRYVSAAEIDFAENIAPLLTQKCLSCHNPKQKKGGLDLSTRAALIRGGESGLTVTPGQPDQSLIVDYVSGEKPEMPKTGEKLTEAEVDLLSRWIADGLPWPADVTLNVAEAQGWSLRPLHLPAVPQHSEGDEKWVRTPIDAFVLAKLKEKQLAPSPEADRRTLIRRLKFDLLGLPPTPKEIAEFVGDPDPLAYEKLIDRYLDSPHYGERWARHWLDVVHYGDTHGYDKDKLRPNAWPYRDYVIRSFNADKPYGEFVKQQIAGDVLDPNNPDGIVATGFIAAGPWDFISHVEVPEEKIDGRIARSLDRDDMVRTAFETFNSTTIGCARCHNHKFDPIASEDYYRLQAVFAAVDRADRSYDPDPAIHAQRVELLAKKDAAAKARRKIDDKILSAVGEKLKPIDQRIADLQKSSKTEPRPEFGYHSQISQQQDTTKWVQVDLGEPHEIAEVVYVGCHDNFNNIGAGFGFPVRFKIEASNDVEFREGVQLLADQTASDFVNPGVEPQHLNNLKVTARYIRITATKLSPRQNDFIFALAELQVRATDGTNLATGKPVTSLDSIEAPVRWQKANLVDGYYFGVQFDEAAKKELAALQQQRKNIYESAMTPEEKADIASIEAELVECEQALSQLPAPQKVYAAAVNFSPQGNFRATNGTPREIRVLHRGNILTPGEVVEPGTLRMLDQLPGDFALPSDHTEGDRRVALAEWLASRDNPLTWRSIVNRVWLYHFGRGIVDSPNDFGRMGQTPTHPELLDWLAATFRDEGQSIKSLHRMICRSSLYRQVSTDNPQFAEIDADNVWYWRMNRRRLEAEAIRDSVLFVSGKLKLDMFGPGFQDFVIDKPEHSPHFEYHLHDPNDPASHRRSIYRFIVRSQQQPFMTTLDCADPSMQVDKRNQTVTALQALSLLNNKLMVAMSSHFAERIVSERDHDDGRVELAWQLALGRSPTAEESQALLDYVHEHGWENTCRLLFNLNEFIFVD